MEILIRVDPGLMKIDEFKTYLENQSLLRKEEIELRVRPPKFRGVDPIVLAAVVGAVGTVVGALIKALLPLAKKSRSKMIVIRVQGQEHIEISADTSLEEIDQVAQNLEKIEIQIVEMDLK